MGFGQDEQDEQDGEEGFSFPGDLRFVAGAAVPPASGFWLVPYLIIGL
jgi:hypothetical protein